MDQVVEVQVVVLEAVEHLVVLATMARMVVMLMQMVLPVILVVVEVHHLEIQEPLFNLKTLVETLE